MRNRAIYWSSWPGKLLLSFIFFMLGMGVANAQQLITVTGKVTSPDNTPSGGVTVVAKGHTQGTATNDSGYYSIRVAREGTLSFSRVGFENKEVNVNNQGVIDLSLDFNNQNMDQVVVVAYGSQKKATVTGAISTISAKSKDAVSLYLRGIGTVNGQAPVLMVDGVPRDITYLDPNEIESVSILKDASATAVFGVRGANDL